MQTLQQIGISKRIINLLNSAGVTTVEQLGKMSDIDIIMTPGCGRKVLRDIREALETQPPTAGEIARELGEISARVDALRKRIGAE